MKQLFRYQISSHMWEAKGGTLLPWERNRNCWGQHNSPITKHSLCPNTASEIQGLLQTGSLSGFEPGDKQFTFDALQPAGMQINEGWTQTVGRRKVSAAAHRRDRSKPR